ncbi:catalase family peroxidase [Peribacillus kribbensis]|uniref:catalase family peroxidase n=1 Tax=Peribacillus kribbensis TaxID=356658 RepID=UPI0004128797|nr:catalase family peroxidase [Peribacillus kribbensis]
MKLSETSQRDLAGKAIDHIETIGGKFPALRRAHARGCFYEGIFKPNGRAAGLTTAPHLQNEKVQAIIRFSNSSTNPGHSDALTPPKGMAVQFKLSGGSVTNLVCTSIPIFFARTPESFTEILQLAASLKKGKPDVKSMLKIAAKYPESKGFFEMLQEIRLPASYAMAPYYSIHAFYLINQEGKRTPAKYIWKPHAGISMFTKKEAAGLMPDYLDEEMQERVEAGPVGFQLFLQIGEEDDPIDDPTAVWPGGRQQIHIGDLFINQKLMPAPDSLLFDPTILPQGIECTPDPILQFRHAAYENSYRRRTDMN